MSKGTKRRISFIVTIDGKRVFSAPIGGKEDHDAADENKPVAREEFDKRMTSPRIKVTAGLHEVGFTFVERPTQEQNMWQPVLRATPGGAQPVRHAAAAQRDHRRALQRQRRRASTIASDGCSSARRRPRRRKRRAPRRSSPTVARRAFRRPVTEDRPRRAAGAVSRGADGGRRFRRRHSRRPREDSHQSLVPVPVGAGSGRRSPPGRAHRVSELDLASRLSFFLWSSIPDDELLNLAIAGRLRAPGVLEAQVRRMIADPRADALMNAFTGQWLQLRNLDKVMPDVLLFPDFDDNVRQAIRTRDRAALRQHRPREPAGARTARRRLHVRQRAAGAALRHPERLRLAVPPRAGDRSESARAARPGQHPGDDRRGQAHVAGAAREVHHLEPAEHAAAAAAGGGARSSRRARTKDRPSTVREQLERHRANPTCASCHRNIDPVGFALENFDAVGQWRTQTREGLPIDSAGVLTDGTKIDGPVGAAQGAARRGPMCSSGPSPRSC